MSQIISTKLKTYEKKPTHECHMSNVIFEIFNLDILGSLHFVLTQMLCELGKIRYLAMNKK